MRRLDNKSCEGLRLRVKTVSHQNLKNSEVRELFSLFSIVYEAKDVKFRIQVPRTCVHKCFVLDLLYLLEVGLREVNLTQYKNVNQLT